HWHIEDLHVDQVSMKVTFVHGKPRSKTVTFNISPSSCNLKDEVPEHATIHRRYHRETPELMTAPQVFDVTHILDFFYGVTWNLDRKSLFNWKDEERGNFERKVKRFFARERFLKYLESWIVFYKKDDELHKIVLRQHQTRAVEKVVER